MFGETNGMTAARSTATPRPRRCRMDGRDRAAEFWLLDSLGNQTPGSPQLAQLAMIEMSDSVSPDCITAVGQYRVVRTQNDVTISLARRIAVL